MLGNAMKVGQSLIPRYGSLKRLASFLSYSTGGLGAVASAHDGLPAYQRNGLLGGMFKDASIAARQIEWSRQEREMC
jgi:hypothetical protein